MYILIISQTLQDPAISKQQTPNLITANHMKKKYLLLTTNNTITYMQPKAHTITPPASMFVSSGSYDP